MNPTAAPPIGNTFPALTLGERLARARDRGLPASPAPAPGAAAGIAPLDDPAVFACYLDAVGSSGEAYVAVHAGGWDHEADSGVEGWAVRLEEAYRGYAGAGDPLSAAGFAALAEPLLRWARARVLGAMDGLTQTHGGAPWAEIDLDRWLLTDLGRGLSERLLRTATLELNVARLSERLGAGTGAERFEEFRSLLRDPEYAAALFAEYPVLARQLVRWTELWTTYAIELLGHLRGDLGELEARMAGRPLGRVGTIRMGAGDTHRNGRSVVIVSFTCGWKVVYKPRSLAADARFAGLLEWVNARGFEPPLRAPAVIDRGTYGWMEHVEQAECGSAAGLKRFYQRQGGFLAVLYALEATDFHYENVIADGEHPVLIDVEALFHNRPRATDGTARDEDSPLRSSVMRVGLLPNHMWSADRTQAFELGGMGGAGGQTSPFALLAWEDVGTDEMRAVRKRLPMGAARNLPRLNGADASAAPHAEAVVRGFEHAYRILREGAGPLLGIIRGFHGVEVRAVMCATSVYARMLQESYHPDLLRDALDRDAYLLRVWKRVKTAPWMAAVAHAEYTDLERGDTPFFSARPGERSLWTSDGREIPGFFAQSALELVERRVRSLDDSDLRRQTWFIRASLATLAGTAQRVVAGPGSAHPAGDGLRQRALRQAGSIADRIVELGWNAERPAWIGLSLVGERTWTLRPVGFDLYGGTAGIALFLGYAARALGRPELEGAARAALGQALKAVDEILDHARGTGGNGSLTLGGFTGLGGVVYTLSHLSALWRDPALAEAAARYAADASLARAPDSLDLIGGSAGWILALLSLDRRGAPGAVLEAAVDAGHALCDRAQLLPTGAAWDTGQPSAQPLAGASHGAAGIARALSALGERTGTPRFLEHSSAAVAYERTLYDADRGNWPDRRIRPDDQPAPSSHASRDMVAWCHGAPGIGLMRLRTAGWRSDGGMRMDVANAVAKTGGGAPLSNHSVCHGALGNLEFLFEASRMLPGEPSGEGWRPWLAGVLDEADRSGWACGVPGGVEIPGFMMGMAGIGYTLLRIAADAPLPCVLALDPPTPSPDGVPCA